MVVADDGWQTVDGGTMTWRNMDKHERRDFIEIGVAWIIGAILLWCCFIIIEAVSAATAAPYEPACTEIHKLSSSPKTCP